MPETGYSGTMEARATRDADEAEARPGARPAPPARPAWDRYAPDHKLESVAAELPASSSMTDCLVRLWQIAAPDWTWRGTENGGDGWDVTTRFHSQPDRTRRLLLNAAGHSKGVARQNLIFQVAITLPPQQAHDWLWNVTREGDSEDYADAMCALAFSGDESAVGWFQTLPVQENCRRLVNRASEHDALAKKGDRAFLRSYRCIETLDCRPYFYEHCYAFQRAPIVMFPWADPAARLRADDTELARRLLPAWMRHFEGHPGSDDMAFRMCRIAEQNEDYLEAARWASRCATLPDQDMLCPGTRELLELAELRLDDRQLQMLNDWPDADRNRNLVNYIRIRRVAAREGYEAALDQLAILTAAEPDLPVAQAYTERWAHAPTKGIDSGEQVLPDNDPLKQVHGKYTSTDAFNAAIFYRYGRCDNDDERMNPPLEAVYLNNSELGEQFRAWETLAELERRRDTSPDPADFSYKIAAVLYHNPTALFPTYGWYTRSWSGVPWSAVNDDDWCGGAFAMLRAAEMFEELADRYPGYAGSDKALFSAGMARIKLVRARAYVNDDRDTERAIVLFERCARDHPQSNLADDAANAARYWRRCGYGQVVENK